MESNGIAFSKASACGNDFLIIMGSSAPARIEEFTRLICDRHNGVGADGVEWVYLPDGANPAAAAHGESGFDLGISLINADGSHAEISGNGTRCVAAWYVDQSPTPQPGRMVRIATGAGVRNCEFIAQHGREFTFRTALGCPLVGKTISMPVQGKIISGVPVDIGNPQFLIFVDEFPSDWRNIAAEVQAHADHFPQGVNVEFVQVLSASEIAIRIFERGVGETMSSGTGSSASAAAAMVVKHVDSRLRVHAPGGSQTVEWNGAGAGGQELYLSGPARLVCRGQFFA